MVQVSNYIKKHDIPFSADIFKPQLLFEASKEGGILPSHIAYVEGVNKTQDQISKESQSQMYMLELARKDKFISLLFLPVPGYKEYIRSAYEGKATHEEIEKHLDSESTKNAIKLDAAAQSCSVM
jgi:hypothetical protein